MKAFQAYRSVFGWAVLFFGTLILSFAVLKHSWPMLLIGFVPLLLGAWIIESQRCSKKKAKLAESGNGG